ncbi:hypothetical protein AOLI_G00089730 [Acnodon oligacanthus]
MARNDEKIKEENINPEKTFSHSTVETLLQTDNSLINSSHLCHTVRILFTDAQKTDNYLKKCESGYTGAG